MGTDMFINMFIKLYIAVLILIISSGASATNYISGDQYTFSTPYSENYIYKWSASAGNYQENDKSAFDWKAPDVNSSTEVTISVLLTDKTCSCQSMDSKTVTVLPNEETKLSIKSLSNSTNSSDNLSDNNESMPISTNLTQNESISIQEGNDTKLDPASEYPENLTTPENLSLKAEIEKEPTLSDLDQNNTDTDANVQESNPEQDLASSGYENGTTTESQPILDTNAIEISTLSFSEGTKVDVAFVENSPVSSSTFAILHGDNTEPGEIIPGSDDLNNAGSLLDTTSTSNSTFNQTDNLIDPIEPTEVIPKNDTNDQSNDVGSQYSEEGKEPSNSTGSAVTPADQPIAGATVSDAVESSASPSLSVEAPPGPEQETPAAYSAESLVTPADQPIAGATVSDAGESPASPSLTVEAPPDPERETPAFESTN
jgi:hypothetical protein